MVSNDGVLVFTVCVFYRGHVLRSERQYEDRDEARAAAERERRPGVLAWVERNIRARDVDLAHAQSVHDSRECVAEIPGLGRRPRGQK